MVTASVRVRLRVRLNNRGRVRGLEDQSQGVTVQRGGCTRGSGCTCGGGCTRRVWLRIRGNECVCKSKGSAIRMYIYNAEGGGDPVLTESRNVTPTGGSCRSPCATSCSFYNGI